MIQRLVWNFEFSHKKEIPLSGLVDNEQDDLKWERRFFWLEDQIISLCNIDDSLLDLANYHQKHKEDTYYLLPHSDYNIKTRRDELQFKPILRKTASAAGFGIKINLDADDNSPELHEMAHQARKEGTAVFVRKESFIYKFHTHPNIKLELARLELNGAVYFSACVEGKSLFLVETLSELLLGNQVSCEYVTFLKNIMNL